LAATLDKGFPYDDGDNSISDSAKIFKKPDAVAPRNLIGKLNG
jgi:hypothetical protein